MTPFLNSLQFSLQGSGFRNDSEGCNIAAPENHIVLDGVNEYLSRQSAAIWDFSGYTNAITVGAWVQTSHTTGALALASRWWSAGDNRCWYWQCPSDSGSGVNHRVWLDSDGTGINLNYRATSTAVNDGSWHLIGWTFQGNGSGVAGDLKLWTDANEEALQKDTDTLCDQVYHESGSGPYIGRLTGGTSYFNGSIYGFFVANGYAFTQADWTAAYNSGTANNYQCLSAYSNIDHLLTFSEVGDDATSAVQDAIGSADFNCFNMEAGDITAGVPS